MNKHKEEYWDSYYNKQNIESIDKSDGWLDKYSEWFCGCSSVLDLGCGAGSNIDALLQKCNNVYAADFSASAIKLLKQKYEGKPVSAHCFDMRNTFPFPNGSFEIVIADLSIHYFGISVTKDILKETSRVLTPGGILLARVHSIKNLPTIHTPTSEEGLVIANGFQRKYFTVNEIRSLLENWHIHILNEGTVHRFSKDKHIIEFAAEL